MLSLLSLMLSFWISKLWIFWRIWIQNRYRFQFWRPYYNNLHIINKMVIWTVSCKWFSRTDWKRHGMDRQKSNFGRNKPYYRQEPNMIKRDHSQRPDSWYYKIFSILMVHNLTSITMKLKRFRWSWRNELVSIDWKQIEKKGWTD